MGINDKSVVSFNSLLQQALTFGVKKVSPSVLPQFIGFIVYGGLVGLIWVGVSLKLDQRIIIAGIVLLLLAGIMTLLLLLGTTIYPLVLNILVVVVVVGFLVVSAYAVVKLAAQDTPREMEIQANLRYADGTVAGNLTVSLEGYKRK